MSENRRVRYGRVEGRAPKNTLVTVREDNTIYFGIARCRTEADRFTKADGLKLANLRCEVARSNPDGHFSVDGSFQLHSSGLFGQVDVDDVTKLLSHFDSVDDWGLKNRSS